jgi:hypothetical protein
VLRALDAGGEECSAEVKSTVLRATKAGRISGTKAAQGRHAAPAELHRVYPAPTKSVGAPRVGRPSQATAVFKFLGSLDGAACQKRPWAVFGSITASARTLSLLAPTESLSH